MNDKIENKIEAILFYKNEPLEIDSIAKILEKSSGEVREGVENLKKDLENRGIRLISDGIFVSLNTAPDMKEMIEKIARDEMQKDIGKAGLETIAIVAYNGGVSKRDIDYIRGVNSGFVLRNLMTRGLVERFLDPKDSRTFLYKPTIALLAHIGIESIEKLPDKDKFNSLIQKSLVNDREQG